MQLDKQGPSIGVCQVHNKILYTSRREAKKAISRHHRGEHKQAYRCTDQPQLWHIGELDTRVISGSVPKAVIHGRTFKEIA